MCARGIVVGTHTATVLTTLMTFKLRSTGVGCRASTRCTAEACADRGGGGCDHQPPDDSIHNSTARRRRLGSLLTAVRSEHHTSLHTEIVHCLQRKVGSFFARAAASFVRCVALLASLAGGQREPSGPTGYVTTTRSLIALSAFFFQRLEPWVSASAATTARLMQSASARSRRPRLQRTLPGSRRSTPRQRVRCAVWRQKWNRRQPCCRPVHS